jgi:hypothetical protein
MLWIPSSMQQKDHQIFAISVTDEAAPDAQKNKKTSHNHLPEMWC